MVAQKKTIEIGTGKVAEIKVEKPTLPKGISLPKDGKKALQSYTDKVELIVVKTNKKVEKAIEEQRKTRKAIYQLRNLIFLFLGFTLIIFILNFLGFII